MKTEHFILGAAGLVAAAYLLFPKQAQKTVQDAAVAAGSTVGASIPAAASSATVAFIKGSYDSGVQAGSSFYQAQPTWVQQAEISFMNFQSFLFGQTDISGNILTPTGAKAGWAGWFS